MYFFLQRAACFTQWCKGGTIYVTLCVSVLSSTDIVYMRKMVANHAPVSFIQRWRLFPPSCFVPISMVHVQVSLIRLRLRNT